MNFHERELFVPWEANLPNFVRSSSNFLIPVVKSIKREGIPFFFRSQNLSTREKIRAKDVISIQRKLKSIIKYERISFFFFDYKIRLRMKKFERKT